METLLIPNRFLHLRHPEGFSDDQFRKFRAGCRVWEAYMRAVLQEGILNCGEVEYHCLPPSLSTDRTIASLPLAGKWTIGSRHHFEDMGSYLLREFLRTEFDDRLEEGLTEASFADSQMFETNWRPPFETCHVFRTLENAIRHQEKYHR